MERFRLIPLILFLSLAGCSTQQLPVKKSPSLIGDWGWVRTCGGIMHRCQDTSDIQESMVLKINADSAYQKFRGKKMEESGRISIYQGKSIFSSEKGKLLKLSKFDVGYTFKYSEDSLLLMEECFDCHIHTYKRLRWKK